MDGVSAYARDQETRRKAAGVRVNPTHWASASVHAHRTWTGQTTMQTWCGIDVNLEDGARQTTELISCLGCGQGSWLAFRVEPPLPRTEATR